MAGAHDRIMRREFVIALGVQSEVDHHDRVLLDDAHQQNDADQRDNGHFDVEGEQREQRPNACPTASRQHGEGMGEAFVKNTEYKI